MKRQIRQGWMPSKVLWEEAQPIIEIVEVGSLNPALPFLSQNIRDGAATIRLGLDDLADLADVADADDDVRPTGFVFHMSRCGSTLVSQLLATIPNVLVLGEPDALKDILRAPTTVGERKLIRLLRHIMWLYSVGLRGASQPLIIKWTSWTTIHLPLIEKAFPIVPACFVTRDPIEVMVSLLDKPTGWLRRKDRCGSRERILPPGDDAGGMTDAGFCARCLARFCEMAAKHQSGMSVVDYRRLPDAVWTEIAPAFGLSLTDTDVSRMRSAAVLCAKDATRTKVFEDDCRRKQEQADAAVRTAAQTVEPALEALRSTHLWLRRSGTEVRHRMQEANRQVVDLYRRGQWCAALQVANCSSLAAEGHLDDVADEHQQTLSLIAKLLAKLCRHAASLNVYRKLLALTQARQAAPEHAAAILNAIGENEQALGLFEEAERSFKHVLDIRMTTCGELHPNFAIGLNALATLAHRRGDNQFAEQLYRRALFLHGHSLGKMHPHYATALTNLASFLVAGSRLNEARPLYEEVVEIRRQALGVHDPVFASALSNLAGLWRDFHDLNRAEQLHSEALDIRRGSLGADHPHVARSLISLGKLQRQLGKLAEAELLFEEAMDILLISVGASHPLTQQLRGIRMCA